MLRRLHIGGEEAKDGWEILNACPGPNVNHVCNANDLSAMADSTFAELYASHILEHLDYQSELVTALGEWFRVLKPGGKLYISVPDMDLLCKMFLSKDQFDVQFRFEIMRIIFGGHLNKWDYHMVGLNEDFLASFLHTVKFTNIRRVMQFGLFNDGSLMKVGEVPISLNMIAEKPA